MKNSQIPKSLLAFSAGIALLLGSHVTLACQSAEKTMAGVLKSRDHVVELQAGSSGALYTVKNLAGSVLAEEITADELLAQFPELQHIVQGVADEASLRGAELGSGDDIFDSKL